MHWNRARRGGHDSRLEVGEIVVVVKGQRCVQCAGQLRRLRVTHAITTTGYVYNRLRSTFLALRLGLVVALGGFGLRLDVVRCGVK